MEERYYETKVALYLVEKNPDYLIRYNQSIIGKYSAIKRQIDVLLIKKDKKVVVECKYYNRKVNIKIIEEFISFLEDVNITTGLLVTNKGVTKSVIKRIAEKNINIQILNENDLKSYDLGGLVPYENDRCAIIFPPYGWVSCGAVLELKSCCVFIPIGSDLENIMAEGNFLYLNISNEEYNIDNTFRKEINYINNRYDGKKIHKIWKENTIDFRKSYLFDKKRYDLSIVKKSNVGFLILHGILKPEDLKWTITAMKKMLNTAIMIPMIHNAN